MADRIQARAIRRCGELLKTFNSPGARTDQPSDGAVIRSQREAADQAGMSDRQRVTAVRVANVPEDHFEAVVEGPTPPTVTALAAMGTKARPAVSPAVESIIIRRPRACVYPPNSPGQFKSG
jgi:hypothetical protein